MADVTSTPSNTNCADFFGQTQVSHGACRTGYGLGGHRAGRARLCSRYLHGRLCPDSGSQRERLVGTSWPRGSKELNPLWPGSLAEPKMKDESMAWERKQLGILQRKTARSDWGRTTSSADRQESEPSTCPWGSHRLLKIKPGTHAGFNDTGGCS